MNDWISVQEEMPEPGIPVLFAWKNSLGNSRVSIGVYCGKFTHSAEFEDAAMDFPEDYDWKPEGETPWRKPGWYEESWEIEFYACITDPVSYWMPVPSARRVYG